HPWGIHVCVIEPGAIKSQIWEKGRQYADRIVQELPAEAAERYAAHVAVVRRTLDMQDQQAADPEKVAKAVEHALFARRPKTRYVVGTDARIQSALVRCLPDKPYEAIIRRVAGMRST